MSDKPSILITGASGYVGSYLVKYFSQQKYPVTALVRKKPDWFSELFPLISYIESDILDLKSLEKVWPENQQLVIHLASANDIDSRENPAQALLINGIGTRNVLTLSQDNNVKQVIFASTLQVYGSEISGKIDEASPTNPTNDYALTHLVGELYCQMFQSRQLLTTILRPANIYGTPMDQGIDRWSLVPNCFCRQAVEEGRIQLRSSGLQQRDFISLSQVAFDVDQIITEKIGSVVNLSSGTSLSILEVAQMVTKEAQNLLNKPITLEILSDQPTQAEDFTVKSKLHNQAFTKDTIRKNLREEIRSIIKLIKKD